MSRNGSGTYSLPAGNPVVTGTTISSTVHNATLSDMATALTQSICVDGQTVPTANLPMGNYKHTGVANGAARTDYASLGQVQDSGVQWLTPSGADTITATSTPAITAYAAGQMFRFVAAGANTTNVTLNINSLGAKAVTKGGTTALIAGDILSGSVVNLVYDGTQFQLVGTQPYDADTLKADVSDNLTVGYTATDYNAGTKSTGTFTPDPTLGNFQYCVNGGAHTLAPPSSSCTMIIQYTNNASAGTITTSGFTKVTGTVSTTNGDDFFAFITKSNGFSHLAWQALQ